MLSPDRDYESLVELCNTQLVSEHCLVFWGNPSSCFRDKLISIITASVIAWETVRVVSEREEALILVVNIR